MKRLISITAVAGLLFQSHYSVFSGLKSRNDGGAKLILKIGVGARAIGMGEAYTAQADDVSSLYWNPAGLALMQERQASFMPYDQMLSGFEVSKRQRWNSLGKWRDRR